MAKHRHHDRGNRGPNPEAATASAVDPFSVLQDYESRSLAHVVGLPEQLDAPGLWRGVGYRVGKRRLASGFDEVVEILGMPPVTPVPARSPGCSGSPTSAATCCRSSTSGNSSRANARCCMKASAS
jgi:twitching motility protein PilI